MGWKTFVVSWLWMALAFEHFVTGNEPTSTLLSNSTSQTNTKYGDDKNSTTPTPDSVLSGSERTRRLIPYMAYYLPPSHLPINQEYSIKKNQYSDNANEQQQQPPATATESAGPLPPPGYITIPVYVKSSDIQPTEATSAVYSAHEQKQPRFRPVIIENQYNGERNLNALNAKTQPLLHLLPPSPTRGSYVGAVYRGPPTNKHKTIQHFPPLPPSIEPTQQKYQRLHEQQPILYRQRPQSAKINSSPFTPSNSVPGHFVPIIYAPIRGSGSNTASNSNSKTINYNYDDAPFEPIAPPIQHQHQHEQQQQQQQYEHSPKELPEPQQQIIEETFPLTQSVDTASFGKETHLLYQQQQQQKQQQQQQQEEEHQQEPQINFVAIADVTGPSEGSATSTQSGNSNVQYTNDVVVDEPKQALDEQQQYVQSVSNQPRESPPPPPQTTYILITTAKPALYESDINTQKQQEYYLSTPRPIYEQTPTLRLKPIAATQDAKYTYVTKRPEFMHPPATPTPFVQSSITKHYEVKYVSTPPNYSEAKAPPPPPPPTPTIKLRPAVNYNNNENFKASQPTVDYSQQQQQQQQQQQLEDPNQLPDIHTSSLSEILHKLQASNHLPQTLTPDNIDNSIKTLITILNNLKNSQKNFAADPPQHHEPPQVPTDYDYSNGNEEDSNGDEHDIALVSPPAAVASGPNKHPGPSTGRAGIDYPNYSEIPQTSFECTQQRYKGFFGDPETNCQVWHYCDLNGGKASFLCPNGTIFSQIALTCDWWFNVKCSATPQLYVLNERLYKYILPFNPKFPEDYSGPLVDKYLAIKFQEMEEKMRLEKEKLAAKKEQEENRIDDTTTTNGDVGTTSTISIIKTRPKIDEQSSERNLLTDDIAEKYRYVTSESSTAKQASSSMIDSETTEPISLSIKPIVVEPPSTIEPDRSDETSSTEALMEISDGSNEHQNVLRSPKMLEDKEEEKQHRMMMDIQNEEENSDLSKISVEKVEVIEIKSNGTGTGTGTGKLKPNVFYADIDGKS